MKIKKYINNELETIGPDAYYDTIPNIALALWDDETVRMCLTEKKDKKKWDEQHGQDGGKMFLGIDGEPLFYLNSDSPSKGNGGLELEGALYAAHSRGNVIKGEKLPERSKFKRKSRHKMWKTVRYDSALAHILYFIEKFREAGFPKPFDYGKGLSTDRLEKELEENERLEEAKHKKAEAAPEPTPATKRGPYKNILQGRLDSKNVQILELIQRNDKKHKGMYYVKIKDGGLTKKLTLSTRDKKKATRLYNELIESYNNGQVPTDTKPEPKPELEPKLEPKPIMETIRTTEPKPSLWSKLNPFAHKSEAELSLDDKLMKARETVKGLEAEKRQEDKKEEAQQEKEALLARIAELDEQISK